MGRTSALSWAVALMMPSLAVAGINCNAMHAEGGTNPCYSMCNIQGGAPNPSMINYLKFDYFPVCVEFLQYASESAVQGTATTMGRMVHYTDVDEFSEMNMNTAGTDSTNTMFSPSLSSGKPAVIKMYTTGKDSNGNADVIMSEETIPYFHGNNVIYYYTALVDMDSGVPTKIEWQYGDCTGCDDDKCLPDRNNQPKACGFAVGASSCGATNSICQPKTYIAWKGTDKKGIVLTSSGSMLTRFSSYGLGKTYSNMRNKV